jgi:methanogen homoisocitrate dehydrogenase
VHGSAPDIAGKNIANPVAALRSAAMLCSHLGDQSGSARIEGAIQATLATGLKTRDLGGSAGTKEFGSAVLQVLVKKPC